MFKILEKFSNWWKEFTDKPDEEYQLLLEQHKKEFQCHICKKPSDGPLVENHNIDNEYIYFNIRNDLWGVPTGLEICQKCGQWTCQEHLNHEKICDLCQKN
jgi:hypothetical protein